MKKNIVMIGIMLVLALVLIRGTKIQSVDEYYLTHMEDIQEDSAARTRLSRVKYSDTHCAA